MQGTGQGARARQGHCRGQPRTEDMDKRAIQRAEGRAEGRAEDREEDREEGRAKDRTKARQIADGRGGREKYLFFCIRVYLVA